MEKKTFKKVVPQFKITKITNKAGKELQRNHVVKDITDTDGGDGVGNNWYYLLEDGTVLQVFKYGERGAYKLFESKEEVFRHNSYFRNQVATSRKGPIPIEESYAVSASEMAILEDEHLQQLSDLLTIPLEQLDHSIASLDKIDRKLQKLSIDKIDQLAMLLNIYGCKVIALETGGETLIVPACEGHVTMKTQKTVTLYFPMYLIVKQLDESEEKFSFGFIVDRLLNGENYKFNVEPGSFFDHLPPEFRYLVPPPAPTYKN